MAKLEVLRFPDPKLRKKAVPVETVNSKIQALARDMLETMYAESGIGLAATQVNVRKRVVVMDLSEQHNEPMYLINRKLLNLKVLNNLKRAASLSLVTLILLSVRKK